MHKDGFILYFVNEQLFCLSVANYDEFKSVMELTESMQVCIRFRLSGIGISCERSRSFYGVLQLGHINIGIRLFGSSSFLSSARNLKSSGH